MKLLRRLFCLLVVILFFIAGVCVADKQFFSQNVIGISVCGDKQNIETLCDFITGLQYDSAEELCDQIRGSDLVAQAMCKRQYFDTCVLENGVIPAGVYDTVHVYLAGSEDGEVQYSTLTGHRFSAAEDPTTDFLQKSYISVLALIGKMEQLTLKAQ